MKVRYGKEEYYPVFVPALEDDKYASNYDLPEELIEEYQKALEAFDNAYSKLRKAIR